jgi:hypothetical protein
MMDRMGLGPDGVMIIHMGVRTAGTLNLGTTLRSILYVAGCLWRQADRSNALQAELFCKAKRQYQAATRARK